jgi:hypothetical protein
MKWILHLVVLHLNCLQYSQTNAAKTTKQVPASNSALIRFENARMQTNTLTDKDGKLVLDGFESFTSKIQKVKDLHSKLASSLGIEKELDTNAEAGLLAAQKAYKDFTQKAAKEHSTENDQVSIALSAHAFLKTVHEAAVVVPPSNSGTYIDTQSLPS